MTALCVIGKLVTKDNGRIYTCTIIIMPPISKCFEYIHLLSNPNLLINYTHCTQHTYMLAMLSAAKFSAQ